MGTLCFLRRGVSGVCWAKSFIPVMVQGAMQGHPHEVGGGGGGCISVTRARPCPMTLCRFWPALAPILCAYPNDRFLQILDPTFLLSICCVRVTPALPKEPCAGHGLRRLFG